MHKPDVMVTVEGGVAQVDVYRPGILVEVRDFDTDGADEDDERLWTNEEGDLCWRYFVDGDDPDLPPTDGESSSDGPEEPQEMRHVS